MYLCATMLATTATPTPARSRPARMSSFGLQVVLPILTLLLEVARHLVITPLGLRLSVAKITLSTFGCLIAAGAQPAGRKRLYIMHTHPLWSHQTCGQRSAHRTIRSMSRSALPPRPCSILFNGQRPPSLVQVT